MATQVDNRLNLSLQRTGGISALGMALCYISMFVIFGGFLSFPTTDDLTATIQYIGEQRLLVTSAYTVGYLLFGFLLCITVQAVHNRLQTKQSAMVNTASLFGIIWVVLMMCAGMAILIGIDMVLALVEEKPDVAISLFYANNMLEQALGGGIEIVGGLWVLLLSIAAWRDSHFSKTFNALGLFVGAVGIMTLWHTAPYLKEIFGLSQIIWFVWLSIGLFEKAGAKNLD